MNKQGEPGVLYAGWLDKKGTSMLTPWTSRYIVISKDSIRHYKDDILKGELWLDETTRVLMVEQTSYNSYKFAIATSKDIFEFGAPTLDERNMWIQKLVYVAEKKSELGAFVMRVSTENDYKLARQWETTVIAHSIDKSCGLLTFKTVDTETYSKSGKSTPSPVTQQRLAVAVVDNPHFASFKPFDNWQEAFEMEVRLAQEQARKDEELKRKGLKSAEPSSMDRIKDYMIDSLVASYSVSATTKFCNQLLEGITQLIEASERQLARKYHLVSAAAQGVTIVADQKVQHHHGTNQQGEGKPVAAEKASDIETTKLLVLAAPQDTSAGKAEPSDQDVPLEVQQDLLSMLGSLRGLILTYRFQDPSRELQINFTRRLAVHQLERSLSRMMTALTDLQMKSLEQVGHAVGDVAQEAVGKAVDAAKEGISEQAKEKAIDVAETVAAELVQSEYDRQERAREHKKQQEGQQERQHQGEHQGEQKSPHSDLQDEQDLHKPDHGTAAHPLEHHGARHDDAGTGAGDKKGNANGGDKAHGNGHCGNGNGNGGKASPKQSEEAKKAHERKVQSRKASLRQLRAILRPLLSRDFLQTEAAPVLQDFLQRNNANLKELQGLAAEVTDAFGDAVQAFIEKKVSEVEERVIGQLEMFMDVIAEYGSQKVTAEDLMYVTVAKTGEAAEKAEAHQPTMLPFPQSTHEVMVKLAREKAAIDQKINKIKTEGSVLWDGSEKALVEMVLLEKCDSLYLQMQDSVKFCVSFGMYAMVDMLGGGTSLSGAMTPNPAPTPPPPAATGYFF